MELNHIALSFMYITLLFVVGIKHSSCIPSKFIFPALPSISDALPPLPGFELDFSSSDAPSNSPMISPTSSLPAGDSPRPSITTLLNDITNTHIDIKVPTKVVEACKKTDHPSECSASVAPLVDGKKLIEPVSVLQGETKAFDQALEVAGEDISDIWTSGGDKQSMATCKQMYENAREEINKAMELSTKNDKYGVNIHVSAALSFIATCKDELPKDLKDDSTIVATNNLLSNLASNCLALGDFAMGDDEHDY